MSEIGQILLLPPPPVRPGDRALTLQGRAQGQVQGADDGSSQAGGSVNEQIRARRFRFRVYEGGQTSNAGTDLDTRRTGSPAAFATSNIDLGTSDSLGGGNQTGGRAASRNTGFDQSHSGASSAFLAQAIAQEQLGEGLHNPPYAAAATAYSSTGASLDARPSAGLNITA
jgi:hypothetical protein